MDLKKAPILNRFVAFFIDWYLSSLFAAIPVVLLQSLQAKNFVMVNSLQDLSFLNAWIACILALLVYIMYYCVIPSKAHGQFLVGQTIGRKLLKVQVTDLDGSSPSLQRLFLRDIIGVLLLQGYITSVNIYVLSIIQITTGAFIAPYFQLFYYAAVILSLLLYIISKRKYLLHDFLSRTQMISIR